MVKVLVLEDDESLNRIACARLTSDGLEARGFLNAADALTAFESERFDLIVSDVMLPVKDGFEFAEEVRARDSQVPILFMTARDDIQSKERGYKIGIDDYIVKPFDMAELCMRVRALLRRAKIENSRKLEAGNLVMDSDEHMAYIDGEPLALTVREFDILFKFLSYPKKTFTRSQLMDAFWDYDSSATSRTVDVYMAKLRDKTAACNGFEIVTVHGLGYKVVLN